MPGLLCCVNILKNHLAAFIEKQKELYLHSFYSNRGYIIKFLFCFLLQYASFFSSSFFLKKKKEKFKEKRIALPFFPASTA